LQAPGSRKARLIKGMLNFLLITQRSYVPAHIGTVWSIRRSINARLSVNGLPHQRRRWEMVKETLVTGEMETGVFEKS